MQTPEDQFRLLTPAHSDDYPYILERSHDDSMVLLGHRGGVREDIYQLWAKIIETAPKGSPVKTQFSIALYQNVGDQLGAQPAAFWPGRDWRENIYQVKFSWLTGYFKSIADSQGFSDDKQGTTSNWKDLILYAVISVLKPELQSFITNRYKELHKKRITWENYMNDKTCKVKCLRVPGSENPSLEITDSSTVDDSIEHLSQLEDDQTSTHAVGDEPKDGENITMPHDDGNSTDDDARTIWPNSSAARANESVPRSALPEPLSGVATGSISTRVPSGHTFKASEAVLADDIAEARQKCLSRSLQQVESAKNKVEQARRRKTEIEQQLRQKRQKAEEELKMAETRVEKARQENLKVAQEAEREEQEIDRKLRNAERELESAKEVDCLLKRSYAIC